MKKCFARSKTAVAVAALLAASASMSVQAVNISENGLGEVGIVPFYTVRNGFDTNISVVNTSDRYVVGFKIRFHEGMNSRDARDFNVFLSPSDVWTATISVDGNGVPFIQTADTSCTSPWIGDNQLAAFAVVGQTAEGLPIKRMSMTNIDWIANGTVSGDDGGPDGIERAQEGYISIIEMGVAAPLNGGNPAGSLLASWAVHGPGQNCSVLSSVFSNNAVQTIPVTGSGLNCHLDTTFNLGNAAFGVPAFSAEFCEPLNVLKVSANLIQASTGVAAEIPVTMLSNYVNTTPSAANPLVAIENPNAPSPFDITGEPGNLLPHLGIATPSVALQVYNGEPLVDVFVSPEDAVGSLLASTSLINEYEIGGDYDTAWVVTFPTKHFYTDPFWTPVVRAPFENMFGQYGSCVTVNYEYYNREELAPFSYLVPPSPLPITFGDVICTEMQTLNPGGGNLFGSQFNYEIELEDGYNSGWMSVNFPQAVRFAAGAITSVDPTTGAPDTVFEGLPAVGFSLKTTQGVFGNATPHARGQNIY